LILEALLIPLLASTPVDANPCRGAYVEARTASVFAGACHYNGEFVTAGREALCAWRIDSGSFLGVDLAGVRIAAIVTGDHNLDVSESEANHAGAAPGFARRSEIVYDGRLSPERAAAAVRWLASTRADLLGSVVDVIGAPLEVAIDAETYSVRAPNRFELTGALMPDRACCAMPQNVWYAPLERLEHPLVGLDATFQVRAPSLDRAWSRPDDNAAFTGRFGVR
jgi:hypothetical protein